MTKQSAKATILLLCSDPVIRSVLESILESEGYVVLPAASLGSAVNWLEKCTPALLIIRPYVENITGHDAALYLRTKCHGIPVLIVSGLPDDDRLRYREALRSFDVFPQPFTAEELLEKVRQVLGSRPDESVVETTGSSSR